MFPDPHPSSYSTRNTHTHKQNKTCGQGEKSDPNNMWGALSPEEFAKKMHKLLEVGGGWERRDFFFFPRRKYYVLPEKSGRAVDRAFERLKCDLPRHRSLNSP